MTNMMCLLGKTIDRPIRHALSCESDPLERMTPHPACGVQGLRRQGLPPHAANTTEYNHELTAK